MITFLSILLLVFIVSVLIPTTYFIISSLLEAYKEMFNDIKCKLWKKKN